jgi:beta-lactamase class A
MRVRSRACVAALAGLVEMAWAGGLRAEVVPPIAPLVAASPLAPATFPTVVDLVGPYPDRAPLWRAADPVLQRNLEHALERIHLMAATERLSLGVALVDITDIDSPRVAAINGDHMMYAASLPKIAILLAAFERIAAGQMVLDNRTDFLLKAMIRVSSNKAAAMMMEKVGIPFIADVLAAPRYRLYDESHNGGLWAGKAYAQDGLWQRDPLHNLSHGGTPMQVARFYYLLETEQLVSPEHSRQMKAILGNPGINHKFVKGMKEVDPDAQLFRKSGSWANWHSDSAIVERAGRRYIAVALAEDPDGRRWLERLIRAFDEVIFTTPLLQQVAAPSVGEIALAAPAPAAPADHADVGDVGGLTRLPKLRYSIRR